MLARPEKICLSCIQMTIPLSVGKWLLIVAIAQFSLSCSFRATEATIGRIAKVDLPNRRTDRDIFFTWRFHVAAHFRAPSSEVEKFLDRYEFQRVDWLTFSKRFWSKELKPENQRAPDGKSIFYMKGITRGHGWWFVVEQDSGRIWAFLQYPETLGVPPPPLTGWGFWDIDNPWTGKEIQFSSERDRVLGGRKRMTREEWQELLDL